MSFRLSLSFNSNSSYGGFFAGGYGRGYGGYGARGQARDVYDGDGRRSYQFDRGGGFRRGGVGIDLFLSIGRRRDRDYDDRYEYRSRRRLPDDDFRGRPYTRDDLRNGVAPPPPSSTGLRMRTVNADRGGISAPAPAPAPVVKDKASAMPKLVHTGDELMKRINAGEGTMNYAHNGQRYVLLHDKDNNVTGIMAYGDGKDKLNDDVARIMTRDDLIAMGMKPGDLKTTNANAIASLFHNCLEAPSADKVQPVTAANAIAPTPMIHTDKASPYYGQMGGFEAPVQPQKLPKP